MKPARFAFAFALVESGCVGASRPVRQLETNDWMAGVDVALPGVAVVPDVGLWFRYAPWTYLDLTSGVTAAIPVDGAGFSGLGEVRVHVPLGPLRLVLAGEGELGRVKPSSRRWITAYRLLGSIRLVLDTFRTQPFLGGKGGFVSNLHLASGDLFNSLEIDPNGEGRWYGGLVGGVEHTTTSGWTFGGALDFGWFHHPQTGERDGAALTYSFYVGW